MAPKKSFSRRGVIAVVLNLAALIVIGFCFWPTVHQPGSSVQVSSAVSSEKPPAIATPLSTANSPKAAKPSTVKKTPVSAVTAADAKVR